MKLSKIPATAPASVTVSVGLACLYPTAAHADPQAGIGRLVDLADAALYRAKHGGRNEVFVASTIEFAQEEAALPT